MEAVTLHEGQGAEERRGNSSWCEAVDLGCFEAGEGEEEEEGRKGGEKEGEKGGAVWQRGLKNKKVDYNSRIRREREFLGVCAIEEGKQYLLNH